MLREFLPLLRQPCRVTRVREEKSQSKIMSWIWGKDFEFSFDRITSV